MKCCTGPLHLKISQETGPCLIFIVISNIGYLASYGVFRGGGVNCELSVMIFDNVKVVSYYLWSCAIHLCGVMTLCQNEIVFFVKLWS